MINIRKIVLLSALLMSASSITAPTYAMNDDEQYVSAQRFIYGGIPHELTPDVISEIRQYGSFLTAEKEYVLQNHSELEKFLNYLNLIPYKYSPSSPFSPYSPYFHGPYTGPKGLCYLIQKESASRYNPNYDSARPEETGPEWIEGEIEELSVLTFKEQLHQQSH
ncbi:MAG: hypothetical protein K2Y08_07295 [Alphaproteobacteria bacterium]|nr:hypothetical protein [Alphaproteobacteria bacterium]